MQVITKNGLAVKNLRSFHSRKRLNLSFIASKNNQIGVSLFSSILQGKTSETARRLHANGLFSMFR